MSSTKTQKSISIGGVELIMARYTGPVCRLCRREGMKLFLKGDRCYTEKCAFEKRSYAPGQHGQRRSKLSEYGMQLREKQKARRIYGIGEGQFRKYFVEADRRKGVTGETLLVQLEQRFDNIVFRSGFTDTRAQARQMVRHNHFTVNGRKANIPSMLLKAGDVVQLKDKSKKSPVIKELTEKFAQRNVPEWISQDAENLSAKILELPTRENIDVPISEQLIVELYSR